jgi:hypothetical protein
VSGDRLCYTGNMPDQVTTAATDGDQSRPVATSPDQSRPDATGPDYEYSLSIEEAGERYAAAGHPRTPRAIQRYCAKGHLDARKITTMFGDKYLIAPYSVSRHIAQINEVVAFTRQATGRDQSRPDATVIASQNEGAIGPTAPATTPDQPRQVATVRDELPFQHEQTAAEPQTDTRYVEQLEKRISEKDEIIGVLRDELKTKNMQIAELSERARETNVLIKGLQDLFLRLSPGRSPSSESRHFHDGERSDA